MRELVQTCEVVFLSQSVHVREIVPFIKALHITHSLSHALNVCFLPLSINNVPQTYDAPKQLLISYTFINYSSPYFVKFSTHYFPLILSHKKHIHEHKHATTHLPPLLFTWGMVIWKSLVHFVFHYMMSSPLIRLLDFVRNGLV